MIIIRDENGDYMHVPEQHTPLWEHALASTAFEAGSQVIDGITYEGLACVTAMRAKVFPSVHRPDETSPQRSNFATVLIEPGDFIYRK